MGASDVGIATLRRIIFRELEAMHAGAPTKDWRRVAEPSTLIQHTELQTTS
jgi:5,5'-dehydrodivanillate O-demethylase